MANKRKQDDVQEVELRTGWVYMSETRGVLAGGRIKIPSAGKEGLQAAVDVIKSSCSAALGIQEFYADDGTSVGAVEIKPYQIDEPCLNWQRSAEIFLSRISRKPAQNPMYQKKKVVSLKLDTSLEWKNCDDSTPVEEKISASVDEFPFLYWQCCVYRWKESDENGNEIDYDSDWSEKHGFTCAYYKPYEFETCDGFVLKKRRTSV